MTERKNYFHKKYLYFSIVFIIVIIGMIFVVYKQKESVMQEREKVVINEQNIVVDIAKTSEQKQRGLSEYSSLCEKCGMLFIFDTVDYYTFWMKDMNFDIDIVWIRDDVVVDISEHVSYKTPEKTIHTMELVDKVLELPSGSVDKFGIIVGNSVHY